MQSLWHWPSRPTCWPGAHCDCAFEGRQSAPRPGVCLLGVSRRADRRRQQRANRPRSPNKPLPATGLAPPRHFEPAGRAAAGSKPSPQYNSSSAFFDAVRTPWLALASWRLAKFPSGSNESPASSWSAGHAPPGPEGPPPGANSAIHRSRRTDRARSSRGTSTRQAGRDRRRARSPNRPCVRARRRRRNDRHSR